MTILGEVLSLYMFLWARKLTEKEGTDENNLTTFYSLNLGLFALRIDFFIYLKDWISEIWFKIYYFCRLPNLKKWFK